jgi:hypothetical protein
MVRSLLRLWPAYKAENRHFNRVKTGPDGSWLNDESMTGVGLQN